MTNDLCPGADQSVQTTALIVHTWKADENSAETVPWDVP